jgi:hypothetical protein
MPLVDSNPASPFGQIIVEPIVNSRYRDKANPAREEQVVRWLPPKDLRSRLPEGFGPELLAWEDQNGNQCFAPPGGASTLVYQCQLSGLEVIQRQQKLSSEQVPSFRLKHQVFSWLQERGARIRRSFSSTSDLMIKRLGRVDGVSHVLPSHLGTNADSSGHPWSVGRLIAEGTRAAQGEGILKPNAAQAIAHGLLAGAELNPLYAKEHETPNLMRMTLYAPSDEPSPSSDVHDEVVARLGEALEQHQADSTERFDKWFKGPHSNLPKSLANRTTDLGKLPRATVQRVLFDLGWDAYAFVSNCVHASMRWFENCLADQLTPCSRLFFEQTYLPQPAYGGLPLLMLMDRGAIIEPAIMKLWDSPDDPRQIAVFHRVLQYFEQMVLVRRQADVQAKAAARRPVPLSTGRSSNRTAKATDAEPEKGIATATTTIEALARTKLDMTDACCEQFGRQIELQVGALDDSIGVVHARCPLHPNQQQVIELTRAEMIEAMKNVTGDDDVQPPSAKRKIKSRKAK